MRHKWYVCAVRCEGCMFCDGGLSACQTCGGFEGSLTSHCPGNFLPRFTDEKVYAGALDFLNGAWIRPRDLVVRMRGTSVAEARALWAEVETLPSMARAQAIRGW